MKKLKLLLVLLFIGFCSKLFSQTPGSLDPSFSSDGKVTTSVGSATDLGTSAFGSNSDFSFVRYNADGSLDITMTTSVGSFNNGGYSVTIHQEAERTRKP